MKKLVSIVLVVAVLGGFAWLVSYIGKDHAPAAVDAGEHVLEGSSTPDGNFEYAEEGATYTINVKYPAATLLTTKAADQKARLAIESALKAEIDDFKQNIAGLDATVLPSLADGHKLMLLVEYKQYQSTTTVSYFYTIFADTGGAHPNTWFKTFVFDEQGNKLKLSDVLGKNPNWLEELSLVVSNDVVAQMKQRLGQDDVTGAIFADGLAPKEENFEDFMLDDGTLVIEIPPYQVAAYVMGSFEVRVPLSSIDH